MPAKKLGSFLWALGLLVLAGALAQPLFAQDRDPIAAGPSSAAEALTLAPLSTSAVTWGYTVVDSSIPPPVSTSVHLDGGGYPHLTYCRTVNGPLLHAYETPGGWRDPVEEVPLDDIDCAGTWGTVDAAVYATAVDSAGRLHVAYQSTDLAKVKYAYDAGGTWEVEQIAGETAVSHIALVLDHAGRPHVVYQRAAGTKMMYTCRDEGGWITPETVDSLAGSGAFATLVLDADDSPHVAYVRQAAREQMYARRGSTGWQRFSLDATAYGAPTEPYKPSLDLDSQGAVHFCYYDEPADEVVTEPRLMHVYRDGGAWQYDELDPLAQTTAPACALVIDDLDRIHLTYQDNQDLKYLVKDESGWSPDTLAHQGVGEEEMGDSHAIVVDDSSRPHIAYTDSVAPGLIMYATESTQLPDLTGKVSHFWGGSDFNRCVPDVVGQFGQLPERPDVLGFHLGEHPDPEWGLGTTYGQHFQGVQRLTGKLGRYLVVSQDRVDLENQETGKTEEWAGLAVVKIASRQAGGSRWRSNRLDPDRHVRETAPLMEDEIVKTVYITKKENHPGGIQVMGDILAVGVDQELFLYNLSEPEVPSLIGMMDRGAGKTGSSTSLAKLEDNRYLLIVSSSSAKPLDFYVSRTPNDLYTWLHIDQWNPDVESTPWEAYQSLNLVTDCSQGDLYLIGTHNNGNCEELCVPYTGLCKEVCSPWNEDWADLFRLDLNAAKDHVTVTKVASHHAYCTNRAEWMCNFDAAAGVYVDPDGRLMLYSTEHENEGPAGDASAGSIKFSEFRPKVPGTCRTITSAWVELWEHDTYRGYSMMIDYKDTAEYSGHDPNNYEEYLQYNKYLAAWGVYVGLDEEVSSAVWCLPPGWAYRLYDLSSPRGDRCDGDFLTLYGTGKPLGIPNLERWGFGDRPSCSFYSQDPPIVVKVYPSTGKKLIKPAYLHEASAANALLSSPDADEPPADADMVTTIDVPAYAVDQQVTLTYTPTTPSNPPPAPLVSANRAFTLAVGTGGVTQADYAFAKPVTVTIDYHPGEVGLVEESSLKLYRWDGAGDEWRDAARTCSPTATYSRDLEEDRLETSICTSGEFALFGTKSLPRVLVDEAHDNYLTLDAARAQEIVDTQGWGEPEWYHISQLVAELASDYELARNTAPLTAEGLAGYDALILPANRQALTAAEVGAIQAYVKRGGGLLILGDCGWENPNPELAAAYGFEFNPACVFAPAPDREGAFDITLIADRAAVGDATTYTQVWGQSLEVSGDGEWLIPTEGVEAWRDDNWNDSYDTGEEGVFDTAGAYDPGCGRVVALGDGTFGNAHLDWTDNDELFRGMVRWLTQARPCSSTRVYLPLILHGE